MTPLLPGHTVRVRSLSEILETLESDSCLAGLPFMPEMIRYCGGTFTVRQRADKACVLRHELRTMVDTVVLEGVRCHGEHHRGCQLGCMIFWREAWLQRIEMDDKIVPNYNGVDRDISVLRTTIDGVHPFCQATELRKATISNLPWWKLSQYLTDLRSKTFSPLKLVQVLLTLLREKLRWNAAERRLQSPARDLPSLGRQTLGLVHGDIVEVKPFEEILDTLDRHGRHQGLKFSMEMSRWCGKRLVVQDRVETIVVEDIGQLHQLRDTVTLQGILCDRHRGCARGLPHLWREAWLKRVDQPSGALESHHSQTDRFNSGVLLDEVKDKMSYGRMSVHRKP